MTAVEGVPARSLVGRDAFARMYDLAAEAPKHVLHLADLPWRFAAPSSQVPDRVRLWESPDGALLAWAMLQFSWHCLDYEIRPEARSDELEASILRWATDRLAVEASDRGERLPFYVSAREDDALRVAAVTASGFVADGWSYIHLARDLAAPVPEPALPEGFRIRPLAGEGEVEAYVALHRAAFDSTSMTAAWRRATLRYPHYEPSLDLVAVGTGGELVGFCVCWLTPPLSALAGGRSAQVEPFGVLPAHQGVGLGRALLLEAFRRVAERGAVRIEVDTVSYEEAPQRAYASVGFRRQFEAPFFLRGFG